MKNTFSEEAVDFPSNIKYIGWVNQHITQLAAIQNNKTARPRLLSHFLARVFRITHLLVEGVNHKFEQINQQKINSVYRSLKACIVVSKIML